MLLEINGYEIEIKAKAAWHKRFNQEDTKGFLNFLSIVFDEAAEGLNASGRESAKRCSQYRKEDATNIFHALEKAGYYDSVR